jgi:hypothetical protein
MDKIISEYFNVSGTAIYLHKYIGTYDQSGNPDAVPDATTIQDVLFLENRDRKYDPNIYELRGIYNVQDNDLDLRQFGLFLTGDTIFIELHLNDMLNMVQRKITSGDVIELPHQRDDAPLNEASPASNKYYVVQDATRASDGYAATWWPHIWRLKCTPLTDSQEYSDILNQQAQDPFGQDQGKLADIISTVGSNMGVNEAIIEEARASVFRRNFETRHFYVIPGQETEGQYPWVYAGDGIPPNGALLLGSGKAWPETSAEGDYFLRLDYEPPTLFRKISGVWTFQEQDFRGIEWTAAHRILQTFLNNNTKTTLKDGTVFDEKTPLYKAVKPRADF